MTLNLAKHRLLRLIFIIATLGLMALPLGAAATTSPATTTVPSQTSGTPTPNAGMSLQETTDLEARLASHAADSAPWPGNPFSRRSFWTQSAERGCSRSRQLARLCGGTDAAGANYYHTWFNTTSYSVPVYVVGAHQPTQRVKLDTWGPDLQQAFSAVPIPRAARAAVGTDKSLSIWQPSTNRLWDFWLMRRVKGKWHARWGGEMDNVSSSPGYFTHAGETDNWGGRRRGC